jgi:hypothetical protein
LAVREIKSIEMVCKLDVLTIKFEHIYALSIKIKLIFIDFCLRLSSVLDLNFSANASVGPLCHSQCCLCQTENKKEREFDERVSVWHSKNDVRESSRVTEIERSREWKRETKAKVE